MKALQPRAKVWDKEVNSLSPIEEVDRMDDSAQIIVLHGDSDEIVPIEIASRVRNVADGVLKIKRECSDMRKCFVP